jgi:autotransporter family porin
MTPTTHIARMMLLTALLALTAAVTPAQQTTGAVSMNGTVSKFVELTSGGPATLTGSSGGNVTITPNPFAVVVNLGELGPANTSSFVVATVPLRLRSNANYNLAMNATVSSTGLTGNKIGAADIGFGIIPAIRPVIVGVAAGTDTSATPGGDPTLAANGAVNGAGRYAFTATKSNLSAFSSATTALSGPRILNAVPASNTGALTANALFAVKPQFFEDGITTVSVTFTASAP